MNWSELYTLIAITMVTIVTPGPDFLIVVKNTLSGSRVAGIQTAFGISTAIWVHIAYSMLIVNLATTQSAILMDILRYCGAAYLFYLGIKAITSTPMPNNVQTVNTVGAKYWRQGFLNNVLNPKATLFFLSVFSQVIAPNISFSQQLWYGVVITAICLTWFCLVPILLTIEKVKPLLDKIMYPFEKIAGILFISYALKSIFI
ncbi:LysE family translocator [Photobacterium nomapromontoriensis]|uniref:LysE family translocator n=1 Tax=Photobacterium nomapromontoriensis TaxID=2910237 RepID=UPI003D1347D9